VSSTTLAFARGLMATNLKATVALRGAFALQVIFMALNNLTFFVFWWALMRRVPVIRGWHLADVQLLFGLVAVAFGLTVTVAGGVCHLGRFIEDGDLDTLLTQPRPVLVYALGMRSHPSGIGDVISGTLLIAASGYLSLHSAPLVIVGIGAASVMFVATGIIFFSLAFWLGKVETIARQLWELLITFSMYPEPLFGGVLRLLLFTILPAGFVGYLPVAVVRAPSMPDVCLLVLAAAGYLVLGVLIFDRGLRRYTSGSRFSMFG
jgi:viologen exporter family transport system permease protein